MAADVILNFTNSGTLGHINHCMANIYLCTVMLTLLLTQPRIRLISSHEVSQLSTRNSILQRRQRKQSDGHVQCTCMRSRTFHNTSPIRFN